MEFKLFGKTISIKNQSDSLPSLSNDAAWVEYLQGKGYALDPMTAIKVAAVFRCVDIISKTMAAMPLHLYERKPDGAYKARDHYLHDLFYILPNKYTTAYELIQMFIANMLLTRGGFLRIKRDRFGKIEEIWNIPTKNTSDIHVNKINGERYIYVIDSEGEIETLRSGDFVYAPSFRLMSDKDPTDPLRIASDVLQLTGDMARYASKGFSGVSPGGFIEHPSSLSDKAYERFKEDFQKNYQGVENSGKWLFLEEGAKAAPWERDMEKSQLLESRKWAVTEVCRVFGVPPHLCMDMEHATFSNIEQQSLEFVRDCVRPLATRVEQVLYRDTLSTIQRKTYFYKFNLNGLLRGDTVTRTQYYNTMRQNGVLNADEIRELEDMNAIPGGAGKVYTVNGNMIPLSSVPQNLPKGAKQ